MFDIVQSIIFDLIDFLPFFIVVFIVFGFANSSFGGK